MWHLGDRSGGSEAQSLRSSTVWILPPPGGACQLPRRALRDSGIAVTAHHSHMLADSPRPVSHALAESRTLWSQFRGEASTTRYDLRIVLRGVAVLWAGPHTALRSRGALLSLTMDDLTR